MVIMTFLLCHKERGNFSSRTACIKTKETTHTMITAKSFSLDIESNFLICYRERSLSPFLADLTIYAYVLLLPQLKHCRIHARAHNVREEKNQKQKMSMNSFCCCWWCSYFFIFAINHKRVRVWIRKKYYIQTFECVSGINFTGVCV